MRLKFHTSHESSLAFKLYPRSSCTVSICGLEATDAAMSLDALKLLTECQKHIICYFSCHEWVTDDILTALVASHHISLRLMNFTRCDNLSVKCILGAMTQCKNIESFVSQSQCME